MPKKNTRNLRDSRLGKRLETCKIPSSDLIVKQFRNIRVNVKNAKRWFVLKKRLSIVTDDELVAYLLDLAEPIIRRDGKCSRAVDWKTDRDKENDLEVAKPEDKDSLVGAEEPLRRSPRKQCTALTVPTEGFPAFPQPPEVPKTPEAKSEERAEPEKPGASTEKRRSRIKHHRKTREKHHREKRTKRKHSKASEENNSSILFEDESSSARASQELPGSDAKLRIEEVPSPIAKIPVECLSPTEKQAGISSPSKDNKNPTLEEISNRTKRGRWRPGEDPTENLVPEKDANAAKADLETRDGRNSKASESPKFPDNSQSEDESPRIEDPGAEVQSVLVPSRKKTIEEKRGKKRKKHGKHDSTNKKQDETSPRSETPKNSSEIIHKRRKKKHKHASSSGNHRAKKFHDVRKAPQDGVGNSPSGDEKPGFTEDRTEEVSTPETRIKIPEVLEPPIHGDVSEPQRLAIKIKLCQDCNDRHIKDICPLFSTENHVKDRLSYDEWLAKHRNHSDLAKALATDDPISEGYAVNNDDNYESEDENLNNEQTKSKTKNESEDKTLNINNDRPIYSRESLPDCFELKITSPEHGVGVYAVHSLPIYAKFGPLVGIPIREMDIPDDFSMRHLWEIDNDGKTSYISTTNPLKSNWIRYTRPADTKEERNVTAVTKNGELYLVTTRNIGKGMELTYWADSQSSAWTRKNKLDKTNCGGCNLNFTHSIYYRLHCCIFHDTRYSLTIRKYHCKVCGAAVLGKDNIMKHAADLHGGRGAYQCQYCRKFFLRLNYLEMHRTYGCSQNPQRSRPLCDFCGRKFCQPQKLKVHIKRMHSDMSEVLREFQCKMCLKLLGSRAALQRHMKEVHHKDVVGAATCDRCGKMFQNKSNLKIHMLTHSGVKPFKCKESDCKAAFTTKQCLQFHYKKVHGLSEDMMPKIERSVAYTFDAYSGGLVEDVDQGKEPRSERRGSQENSNSVMSLDDCSSDQSSRADVSMSSFQPTISEFESGVANPSRYNLDRYILNREEQEEEEEEEEEDLHERSVQGSDLQDCAMQEREIREQETQDPDHRIQEREVLRSSPSPIARHSSQEIQMPSSDSSSLDPERISTEVDFYGARIQSKGSKKWMGQFTNINDPEIQTHRHTETRQEIYEFNDSSMKKSEERSESVPDNLLNAPGKLSLNIYRRPESTNASLLVEAALDAAERDIGAVTSPIIDENDRETGIYAISSQLQSRQTDNHLDTYIQQQENLISPSSVSQDNRKTPNSHVHIEYHLHRPVDYINSPRTHGIEQYLPGDDLPRVESPGSYNIHMQQEDLGSPSATPEQNRYGDVHHHHHHHQQQQHHHHHHHHHPPDNLSSDEGDSVAQNLSISVKEKSLQLDLSNSYKYEQIDAEFNRDRNNFEPLVINNGELQGLDMSARGFHHSLGNQINSSRYHHHLYEINDRQSVDLSRTTGYAISPTANSPNNAYPQNDVLRIVSLDLTPGHSVDLSLSRSHDLHSNGGRIVTPSPQSNPGSNSNSHGVPQDIETRIMPSSSPSVNTYNSTYPVSPSPYHPPRPGYHHYSGYY